MGKVLKDLKARWLEITKEPMPEAIARLPIDKVIRAVELTEEGNVVVVPRDPVRTQEVQPSSMMQHDKHGEFS